VQPCDRIRKWRPNMRLVTAHSQIETPMVETRRLRHVACGLHANGNQKVRRSRARA